MIKAYMQRMGRSLMLPVATLPVAALFTGIGYWIDPNGWGSGNVFSAFMLSAGNVILNNLGILFAVGLAYGMSKDKDGAAALAGMIAFLTPMKLLAPATVAMLLKIKETKVDAGFSVMDNSNVFIGILAGLIAAGLYNRFSGTKLPMALSFFSGKRLVPIVTAGVMALVSLVLLFIWPTVFTALVDFGKFISALGPVGAGLYALSNRLLIPTGLHHALNNVFWFNTAGINDIGNFWSNVGTKGITGRYQAGFFPVMMFGLPAGALAIYQCARPEKKKQTASLMVAAAFASFFTGVTEPLEFSFMFIAWPLYVVHACLTGLSVFIAAVFHWTAGFNFSAGLIDYILSLRVPIANKPYMLLVQGVFFAVIYYVVFRFVITKWNLMTPGREEDDTETVAEELAAGDNKHAALARKIYGYLGGDANVTAIDNCTTRLRLQLADTSIADQAKIKATGVPGVKVIDDKNIQVIVGTEVQFVADEMKKLQGGQGVAAAATATETKAPVQVPTTDATAPKTQDVYAVADGKLIPITEVGDPVFSEKMMGDGFAVIPTSGEIFAPVDGTILNIFPTKHALGIATATGIEVLLHMGIDTVALNGAPFELFVNDGQKVARGQLIAKVDLAALEVAGKKNDMIVVFTNADKVESLDVKPGTVTANAVAGTVTSK